MPNSIRNFLKQTWQIILLGLLIRVLLSLFAFHPDIRAFNLAGHLIAQGNILNLYDYLAGCMPDNPYLKTFGWDLFIYPPAIYLLHGIFNFIFGFIFGQQIMNGYIIENASHFKDIFFNLHLLLLKIPYFFFDLAAAYFISKLFEDQKKKMLAFALWIFNPVTLYATYMLGQFDLIPAFFTIISLYFANKNKLYLAALMLGFGIAFKLYPIFLLPPLLFIAKKWEKRAILLIITALPYLLTVIPFIYSHGFRSTALLAGLTQKTMYAQISVSGGESLLLFPMVLVIFYFAFLYSKNTIEELWSKQLVVLILFFIFTHFHPQWLVWLTPFLIIELINSNFKHLKVILVMIFSFIASLFLFDTSLTLKIFAPLYPDLYLLAPDLKGLGVDLDINFLRSVLQSIFAAGGFYLIFVYRIRLKDEK